MTDGAIFTAAILIVFGLYIIHEDLCDIKKYLHKLYDDKNNK